MVELKGKSNTEINTNGMMMPHMGDTSLQIYENQDFGQIRIILIDNNPWFVGKDVASILGYERADNAIRLHVDEYDKLTHQISASGQKRNMVVINESGLYSLIFSSKLPNAKKFTHWVTSEVLPSIRRHGAYMTPEKIEEVLYNPDLIIGLATELKNERQQRIMLEAKAKKDKPKVNFANSLLNTKTCIPAMDLAKILKQNGIDIGQHRLYGWMRDNGYFIKKGDSKNLPTQKAMNMGLFKISEKSWFNAATQQCEISRKTLVTPKGQMYFINKFLNDDSIIK